MRFASTLEKVTVQAVEDGWMTKDLALLVGPDQKWLTTMGYLEKVDEYLNKALAGLSGRVADRAGGKPPARFASTGLRLRRRWLHRQAMGQAQTRFSAGGQVSAFPALSRQIGQRRQIIAFQIAEAELPGIAGFLRG
jgi:hypothetical protein